MKQKVVIRVLLGVLAVLLLAGMVVQFTPALSGFTGQSKGTPALKVNGTTVTVEELERVRQGNPVLSQSREGLLGEDFKTVIIDQKVREVLLTQAAKDVDVSRQEVNAQVKEIREANNLTKTKDWVDRLSQLGYTDATFREQLRNRLKIEKKAEEVKKAAGKATEAEAKLYYDLNPQAFQAEARLAGRQIVVKDEAKAKQLLEQARGGADFAKLAAANSLEGKTTGGAIGGVANGKPKPVTAIALPAEVSEAAFKLTEGGLTDVVKSGDKFYVVKVEQYLPAGPKPYAEAKSEALKAAENARQNEAIEKWLDGLEKDVKVEAVDKTWAFYNPTVATVGQQPIAYAEVLTAMLSNPSFEQLLQQGGDQAESFVNGFFKPQVLDTLVQQYAAKPIAEKLKLPVSGSRQELLAALQAYGGRTAKVTDAEIERFYQEQKAQFSTPASATVTEATFRDRARPLAFRSSFVKSGADFTGAAPKAGATVAERGAATAGQPDPTTGQPKLTEAVEKAVFQSNRLADAGEGSVTDVVEAGGRFTVVYVTDLVKATTQPLAGVRDQIRQQLEAQKKAEAGQQFVQAQLKSVKVDNQLEKVLAEVTKRAEANAPKKPAAGTNSTGGTTGENGAEGTKEDPAGTAGQQNQNDR